VSDVKTHADGLFTFEVNEGLSYVGEAVLPDANDRRHQLVGRTEPVVASASMPRLEIVLGR
jgi:hypothetical protein